LLRARVGRGRAMVGEGAVTVRRVGGMLWLRADGMLWLRADGMLWLRADDEAKKKACVCDVCDGGERAAATKGLSMKLILSLERLSSSGCL